MPDNVKQAIGQVFAGVTLESAARANATTVKALELALDQPDAYEIEAASEWDAVDLLKAEFRDTPDALEGIIPIGLSLVSAAPKVGKTRWMSQLSVAAVFGSPFLSRHVTRTEVLTLVLEDGARRYRKSLHSLVGANWPSRGRLTVRTASLRLDEGGIAEILRHLDKHPECRLVVIDVLARVRPRGRGTDKYQLDYDALATLQRIANIRQIAIVVVHHTNQRSALEVSNVFELVSGTSGLIGAVDSMLVLQRRHQDDVGILSVTGREVEDQTIALSFNEGWWGPAPEGMPADLLTETQEIRSMWLWLADHDGANTDELANRYGRTNDATQKVLHRLADRALIDRIGTPTKGRAVCWQVVRRDVK
jgi:RecA-family ATPase